MKRSRREFLKNMAAVWSTAVAGTMITGCGTDSGAASSLENDPGVTWSKALSFGDMNTIKSLRDSG